jgi:hypothetical protein
MKRKRWPQLLMQELVGAAVWCLIPYQANAVSSSGSNSGWKVGSSEVHVFFRPDLLILPREPDRIRFTCVSGSSRLQAGRAGRQGLGRTGIPCVICTPRTHRSTESLFQRTFAAVDLPRLLHSITTTISPATSPGRAHSSLTYQTSNSRTSSENAFEPMGHPSAGLGRFSGPARPMSVYTRLLDKSGREVLFELRGHAYFGGFNRVGRTGGFPADFGSRYFL